MDNQRLLLIQARRPDDPMAVHEQRCFERRLADQAVGDMRVDMSQKAKAYRDQAAWLLELAGREGSVPTPYAGGITLTDKEIDWNNTDLVRPGFRKGQFDDTRDGNPSTDLRPLWAGADT